MRNLQNKVGAALIAAGLRVLGGQAKKYEYRLIRVPGSAKITLEVWPKGTPRRG